MKSIIYGFGIIITIMSIFGIAAFIMYFTNKNNQRCANYEQYDDNLPIVSKNLTINPIPYQIFVIWFGAEMNKTRKKCLESIGKLGVPLILITQDNLHEWVVKDDPLHPAFYYLSGIHRADYLRCYLLHHYGGGYTDVKYYDDGASWVKSFDKINQDPNIWLLGSQEKEQKEIACPDDYFHRKKSDRQWNCKIVKENYKNLVSMGNFICRAKTLFTYDWRQRLHHNLSNKLLELIKHPPPAERCCQGKENGYPFRWAESLAEITHPLQYIYNEHVKNGLPSFNWGVEYGEEEENKPKNNPFSVLELSKLHYIFGTRGRN